MRKMVANPIPLWAGQRSIQACSKGNFVYSFNGHVPFGLILSYKQILLTPFLGTGQLCPSMGWTCLLAHGVPFTDNEGKPFEAGDLLKEVRSLLGLKKATFSMPP